MSNVTHINFHYKGAHVHCESDCGAPDTKSAVEAVDQALKAAGVATFDRETVFGGTAMAQCSDEANAVPDATADDSQQDDSAEDKQDEDAAEAEAKAKADAKKKADADAKAKKAADKKAADEKAAAKKKADEDAAEKAAQEEQASENADASEKSEEKPEITLETLRDQVMAYAKEKGNVQGKRLVQEIGGAEKISGVPEDKWLELYKAAGGEV